MYANRINGLWNLIEIDCDTFHMFGVCTELGNLPIAAMKI